MPRLRRKPRGAYHHGDLERALVEAALRTIRDHGVQSLTLRSVAARLDVSRTALYRHFRDKADLLARVAAEGFRRLYASLTAARASALDGKGDVLQAMTVAYVQFALDNPSHYQTMFTGVLEHWERYPELVTHAEAAFAVLLDTVRDEQQRGLVVAGDPVELAEITWALSHGVATLGAARKLERTPTTVEELARLACHTLERGLRPR